MRIRLAQIAILAGALLLLLCVALPVSAATSYDLYTVQPGDTPENLAARNGISVDEILSVDNGPWEPGKRVALVIKNSPTVSAPPAPTAPKVAIGDIKDIGYKLASVTRGGAEIRSLPGGGSFLFSPEAGSKVVVTKETPTQYGVIMADQSVGWVNKEVLSVEGALDSNYLQSLMSGNKDVIQEAFRYLGMPYRYGGKLPYDTDCSLLVQTAFRAQGVNLPRTAAQQCQVGIPVALSDVQPGDRLYFINSKGVINHTGLFIGNNQFIHASSNRGCVAVDRLAGRYLSRLTAIRR